MFEFPDEDFKAATIKVFQQVNTNTLQKNDDVERLSKE